MSEHGVIPDATVGSGEPSTVEQAEVADCGCPVTRKQAVITTHTSECSTAQHVARFKAYNEYGPDADEHKPTAHLPEGSPHVESCRACGEDWPCGNTGFEHDIEDPADAELTDIDAQVAADRRVIDAAGRMRDLLKHQVNPDVYSPEDDELIAAVDARRALDNGEGQQLAVKHECGEVGNAMGGYNCTCGEPWIDAYGGCVNAPEGQKAAIRAAWKTSQERRAQMLAGGEGQEAS